MINLLFKFASHIDLCCCVLVQLDCVLITGNVTLPQLTKTMWNDLCFWAKPFQEIATCAGKGLRKDQFDKHCDSFTKTITFLLHSSLCSHTMNIKNSFCILRVLRVLQTFWIYMGFVIFPIMTRMWWQKHPEGTNMSTKW